MLGTCLILALGQRLLAKSFNLGDLSLRAEMLSVHMWVSTPIDLFLGAEPKFI
jgi:hypothetical protein